VTVNGTIRLTVDPIYSGGTATFHIDNCAPKSWFYLCWSLSGAGPFPIAGTSYSLSLSPPIGVADPRRLNQNGAADFGPIPVPSWVVAGTLAWFQVVTLDLGGAGLEITNMVPITVQ